MICNEWNPKVFSPCINIVFINLSFRILRNSLGNSFKLNMSFFKFYRNLNFFFFETYLPLFGFLKIILNQFANFWICSDENQNLKSTLVYLILSVHSLTAWIFVMLLHEKIVDDMKNGTSKRFLKKIYL